LIQDGIGAGRWDGAPSVKTVIRTLDDPVTFVYMGDGHDNPAKGAAGGHGGVPAQAFLCKVGNGTDVETMEELPTIHEVTIPPGYALCGIYSSAGGYGDPLERDPEKVGHRVREGWLSIQRARDVYGVMLNTDTELYTVDRAATEKLRETLRKDNRGAR
jgi:N-methylhydantoinase B